MKLIALFTSLFIGSFALANELPARQVSIPINEAFIPAGFDSQSDAYVVASGIFPNGCYQWDRAEVSHDPKDKTHTVKAFASVSQGMCIMVLVPFTKEISLGQLESGKHTIRFHSDDGTYMEKQMEIE